MSIKLISHTLFTNISSLNYSLMIHYWNNNLYFVPWLKIKYFQLFKIPTLVSTAMTISWFKFTASEHQSILTNIFQWCDFSHLRFNTMRYAKNDAILFIGTPSP